MVIFPARRTAAGSNAVEEIDESRSAEELAWDEACRRDDVIRHLLGRHVMKDGRFAGDALKQAAAELGVSSATIYRLVKKFRADNRVTALLGDHVKVWGDHAAAAIPL